MEVKLSECARLLLASALADATEASEGTQWKVDDAEAPEGTR